MTKYLILEAGDHGWQELGTQEATSAKAAISTHLKDNDQSVQDARFVAVPARSWQPVSVSVQQSLKFS